MNPKIVSRSRIKLIARELRKKGRLVVFTNGCFDIIHAGHIRYLKKARSFGDKLITAVNSDKSVRRIKGRGRPVIPEGERMEILAALECVSYAVLFEEDTPEEIIKEIKPDILVKGGDYRLNEILGRDTVRACGGTVITVPLEAGMSTTAIIKKIRDER